MCQKRSTILFDNTNVRPSDWNVRDNNKGDCTTRAMTYCLNGVMSYDEIEAEQYRLGRVRGTVRNANGTWDLVMKRYGYSWLYLSNGKKSRANIAVMLKSVETPMITHSRGHVAVVHKGMVKDNWNSTSGRVDNIMVKAEDKDKVVKILGMYGIECENVEKCKVIVKHHRRRRIGWFYG